MDEKAPKRLITTKWLRNHYYWNFYHKNTYYKTVLFQHYKLSITAVVFQRRKVKDTRWYYILNYKNVPRYENYSGYCFSKEAAMARIDAFLKKKKFKESKRTLAELEILK